MYKILHKKNMQDDWDIIETFTIYKSDMELKTVITYIEALEFILHTRWIEFTLETKTL